MSKPSTAVKNRYNVKTYGVLAVRLPKELVTAFKEKTKERGDSQAAVIKKAVEAYLREEQ